MGREMRWKRRCGGVGLLQVRVARPRRPWHRSWGWAVGFERLAKRGGGWRRNGPVAGKQLPYQGLVNGWRRRFGSYFDELGGSESGPSKTPAAPLSRRLGRSFPGSAARRQVKRIASCFPVPFASVEETRSGRFLAASGADVAHHQEIASVLFANPRFELIARGTVTARAARYDHVVRINPSRSSRYPLWFVLARKERRMQRTQGVRMPSHASTDSCAQVRKAYRELVT